MCVCVMIASGLHDRFMREEVSEPSNSKSDENGGNLRHRLANADAENQALKSMLNAASERIEELVEANCADEAKEAALRSASRFRRAANL